MKTIKALSKSIAATSILAATFVVGFYLGSQRPAEGIYYENGIIYYEGGIAFKKDVDFEKVHQVFQSVVVNGTTIDGKIVSLDLNDVKEICEAIDALEDVEPILRIEVIDSKNVKVQTGVIIGPLNGGGRYFHAIKEGNRWKVDPEKYSFWVS